MSAPARHVAPGAHVCIVCRRPPANNLLVRNRCTPCREQLEAIERASGGLRPYGYTTTPERGGRCVDCERDDGRHDETCALIDETYWRDTEDPNRRAR